MPRLGTTLLNLGNLQPPPARSPHAPSPEDDELQPTQKRWFHYAPIFVVVILLLAPHPSLLHVFIQYHLLVLSSPIRFGINLVVTYTFTFLAFCSLIVCVARDPGPVPDPKTDIEPDTPHRNITNHGEEEDEDEDGDEVSLTEALMGPARETEEEDDYSKPGRWCRVCWRPKPERTHHCSQCGRCVLKMDHHCPWMAGKCIGHRTYPSFLHFLTCVTIFAGFVAAINIEGIVWAVCHPADIDDMIPVHMIFLSFAGVTFFLVVGSFLSYHIYLVSTNQTTIENISPYLLLRHIPPLPPPPLPSFVTPAPPHPSTLSSSSLASPTDMSTSPTVDFYPSPNFSIHDEDFTSNNGSQPHPYQYPPPYSTSSSRTLTPSLPEHRTHHTSNINQVYQGRLSNPPQEHELSYDQRRLVKDAHSAIKMYDIGLKANWAQVLGFGVPSTSPARRRRSSRSEGWKDKGGADGDEGKGKSMWKWRWRFWIARIVWGGGPSGGDGMRFPANPRREEMLARLASELRKLEK